MAIDELQAAVVRAFGDLRDSLGQYGVLIALAREAPVFTDAERTAARFMIDTR